MARAVKSEEELAEVRDAMDIILDGFWALVAAYAPGKTEAEIMAPAVERFFARGAGPRMMNILLSGANGEAEAHLQGSRTPRRRSAMTCCCTRWKSPAQADTGSSSRAPLMRGQA